MKQPISPFFLGHSALIGCILAVSAVAQSPMSTSSVASINNLKNAAYCADTSVSANTITCSTAVGFTGYAAGQAVDVLLANTVTGATTINANALGAKAVTYNGTNALTSAIGWNAGATGRLLYDGTRFVMQGIVSTGGACPAGSAGQLQYFVSAGVCGAETHSFYDSGTGVLTFDTGGSLVMQAHNAMGPQGVVDGPFVELYLGTFTDAVLTTKETVTDMAANVAGQTNWFILNPAGAPQFFLGNGVRIDLTGSQDFPSVAPLSAIVEHQGSGDAQISSQNQYHVNSGSGDVIYASGFYYEQDLTGTGNFAAPAGSDYGFGYQVQNHAMGDIANPWGYQCFPIVNDGGGTITDPICFYVGAMGGTGVTAPYPFWSDEQGVYAIRAINTFDGVFQAVPRLYNPQVAKYVPDAPDFERCIPGGQWNGNVCEIGTQAGGTGILRRVRFIGLSDEIPTILFAALSTPGNATENYCSDCTVTSAIDDTCAGSGSGAFAFRIAGAWKCNI